MNRIIYKTVTHTGTLIALSLLLITSMHSAQAQDVDADQRAAREERREQGRAQRMDEIRTTNPELASEMEAFGRERQAGRAERDADFRQRYPEMSAARDERRSNGGGEFRSRGRGPGAESGGRGQRRPPGGGQQRPQPRG